MPFDAATLALVEDALSEGFKYHAGLDSFLTRSGVSQQMLEIARSKAEHRNASGGRFSKAPKRFVVQELLASISNLQSRGDPIIANIVTGLTKATLPDASEIAASAIESLKAKIKADQQEQKQKQEAEADRQRQNARSTERVREAERAKRQAERDGLRDRFVGLMAEANAQRRGYLLETFLNDLFEHEGLDPRGSFKLIGEQIDGSFAWRGRTALMEAKWTKEPVAGADFGAFSYKIEGKTADTRGLFVSINGYSTDAIKGMNAKGSLKFVCIDGAHIMRALVSYEGLQPILERVWRHADETGDSYLPVSEL
jgi:hypothetical protein